MRPRRRRRQPDRRSARSLSSLIARARPSALPPSSRASWDPAAGQGVPARERACRLAPALAGATHLPSLRAAARGCDDGGRRRGRRAGLYRRRRRARVGACARAGATSAASGILLCFFPDSDTAEVIAFRHKLHERPELAGEERDTARAVRAFLERTPPRSGDRQSRRIRARRDLRGRGHGALPDVPRRARRAADRRSVRRPVSLADARQGASVRP